MSFKKASVISRLSFETDFNPLIHEIVLVCIRVAFY